MKRIITAIAALLYISTSMGATVHLHYCMGKLADWGLGYNHSKVCGECGMDENDVNSDGCCKDEHTFIKNDNDQKIVESSFPVLKIGGIATLPVYIEIPSVDISSLTEKNPLSNAPPRQSGVAVYLFNRTLLI